MFKWRTPIEEALAIREDATFRGGVNLKEALPYKGGASHEIRGDATYGGGRYTWRRAPHLEEAPSSWAHKSNLKRASWSKP